MSKLEDQPEGVWQANENTLLWKQVIHKKGIPHEETCEGKFGFLPDEDGSNVEMVFIVYKTDNVEEAIAIPKTVLEQALTQGWFPKRGTKR